MSDSLVLAQSSGPVLTLTLNRPASLNSLTSVMVGFLRSELDAAAETKDVRCVVLTGAGRGFCAGQDLSDPAVAPEPGGGRRDLADLIERFYTPLVMRLRSMPISVVAMVNGVAAGAGANLALNCDFVLAARSASFIQAFAKIGLVPDTGGTWLLPRLVGRQRALGLALLGDKLPAADAERIGLIWKCVDDAALHDETHALTQRLAAMPVKALAATRQAMDAAMQLDMEGALREEARLQREFGWTADHAEGLAAFGAKRAPRFADR